MTKKDIESVKRIVKKMLDEMLFEEDITYDDNYGCTNFPVKTLDKIEAFLGHPVEFMGIS